MHSALQNVLRICCMFWCGVGLFWAAGTRPWRWHRKSRAASSRHSVLSPRAQCIVSWRGYIACTWGELRPPFASPPFAPAPTRSRTTSHSNGTQEIGPPSLPHPFPTAPPRSPHAAAHGGGAVRRESDLAPLSPPPSSHPPRRRAGGRIQDEGEESQVQPGPEPGAA